MASTKEEQPTGKLLSLRGAFYHGGEGGEGIVPVFEEGTWNRVEGHWNWWWYLKLANDHFVNLLILSPFHPRNELESA